MSRWRPPAEKSTALITPQGHARLKTELDELWRVRRPEVVRALAAAAAEGDRSENAEYTYRKKQLGEIDRRVRYLSKRLEALRVVDTVPSDPDAVFFGAEVALEDVDSGECVRYRIVGRRDRCRPWLDQHRLAAGAGAAEETRGRRTAGRPARRPARLRPGRGGVPRRLTPRPAHW